MQVHGFTVQVAELVRAGAQANNFAPHRLSLLSRREARTNWHERFS